jgi:hypothetical protein
MDPLDLIRRKIESFDDPQIDLFVDHFRRRHGDALAAVIFYGSCLLAETRTATSFYDFYLLTDAPLRFFGNPWQSALSAVLPPSIFYGQVARAGQPPLRYKSCVISLRQFGLQTSARADDLHHLGRFSKRFALIYARDEATRQLIARGARAALEALLPHSLALLPRVFGVEDLVRQQLSLSYLGEERVAEPTKVERLMMGERTYYLELHRLLLARHAERTADLRPLGEDRYERVAGIDRCATERFVRRSRRRGLMRWPKYLLTVDNWLEIQLEKLQRYHGVELELTERQKRYPLIFGWPKFFELRRKGIIK